MLTPIAVVCIVLIFFPFDFAKCVCSEPLWRGRWMVSFGILVSGKMQVTGLLGVIWLMADPGLHLSLDDCSYFCLLQLTIHYFMCFMNIVAYQTLLFIIAHIG